MRGEEMTDAYSVRELDEKFETIMDKLDRIETQTIKTNGRVVSLESWKSFLQGGLAILTLLVVPIIIYFPPPSFCGSCAREVDVNREPHCDVCSQHYHQATCGYRTQDQSLCQSCLDGDVKDAQGQ